MEYFDDEETNGFEIFAKWQVFINGQSLDKYLTKEEAIDAILEEIDFLTDGYFSKNIENIIEDILGETITNMDNLNEFLSDMYAIDFYNFIKDLMRVLHLKIKIKLINLDNDEPEFGEL